MQDMREAMIKPQYNVQDYYHQRGIAQAIATSDIFEKFTLAVIMLNAAWIAVDTDYNSEALLLNADPVFQVADHSFCAYFTLELLCRFMAFKRKRRCLRDAWFCFDSILVFFMIVEAWVFTAVFTFVDVADVGFLGNASILRMVRMARMLRISRMARLLRAMPELVILLKGIGAASRSVCIFFLLWFIIIYVFAVLFRQIAPGNPAAESYFDSVPQAMNTLLLQGILPDNSLIVHRLGGESPAFWIFIVLFLMLAGVTVLYMLVGVLVDVVRVVAITEKEAMIVQMVASQLRHRLQAMGRDPELPITKFEFTTLVTMPEIALIMQNVGVDVAVLLDMVDVVFDESHCETSGLDFQHFVEVILNMRGSNPATVRDVKQCVRVLKTVVHSTMDDAMKGLKVDFQAIRESILDLKNTEREAEEDDEDQPGHTASVVSADGDMDQSSAPLAVNCFS